jgi:hypothetical protein
LVLWVESRWLRFDLVGCWLCIFSCADLACVVGRLPFLGFVLRSDGAAFLASLGACVLLGVVVVVSLLAGCHRRLGGLWVLFFPWLWLFCSAFVGSVSLVLLWVVLLCLLRSLGCLGAWSFWWVVGLWFCLLWGVLFL